MAFNVLCLKYGEDGLEILKYGEVFFDGDLDRFFLDTLSTIARSALDKLCLIKGGVN